MLSFNVLYGRVCRDSRFFDSIFDSHPRLNKMKNEIPCLDGQYINNRIKDRSSSGNDEENAGRAQHIHGSVGEICVVYTSKPRQGRLNFDEETWALKKPKTHPLYTDFSELLRSQYIGPQATEAASMPEQTEC